MWLFVNVTEASFSRYIRQIFIYNILWMPLESLIYFQPFFEAHQSYARIAFVFIYCKLKMNRISSTLFWILFVWNGLSVYEFVMSLFSVFLLIGSNLIFVWTTTLINSQEMYATPLIIIFITKKCKRNAVIRISLQ